MKILPFILPIACLFLSCMPQKTITTTLDIHQQHPEEIIQILQERFRQFNISSPQFSVENKQLIIRSKE